MSIDTTTGGANSVSYCSYADADAYFLVRGVAAWAALTTEQKEAALVKGCDYLTQTYRSRFAGYRTSTTQALDWPRQLAPLPDATYGGLASCYPSDTIPREVVYANAEAAIRAAAGELIEDLEPQVASETVGPISTTYFQGGSRIKRFPVIDKLLQPLLAGGGCIRVVRA